MVVDLLADFECVCGLFHCQKKKRRAGGCRPKRGVRTTISNVGNISGVASAILSFDIEDAPQPWPVVRPGAGGGAEKCVGLISPRNNSANAALALGPAKLTIPPSPPCLTGQTQGAVAQGLRPFYMPEDSARYAANDKRRATTSLSATASIR